MEEAQGRIIKRHEGIRELHEDIIKLHKKTIMQKKEEEEHLRRELDWTQRAMAVVLGVGAALVGMAVASNRRTDPHILRFARDGGGTRAAY